MNFLWNTMLGAGLLIASFVVLAGVVGGLLLIAAWHIWAVVLIVFVLAALFLGYIFTYC